MTTKENDLFLMKQFSVPDRFQNDKSNQFFNLNLNQTRKYSSNNELIVQSFSKSNKGKSSGYTVTDNSKEKGWNKSTKNLCFKASKNPSSKIEGKEGNQSDKNWMNEMNDFTSNKNDSTLSLHIAAYENSNEMLNEIKDSSKKSKAFKFIDSLSKFQGYQNSFEFPRQIEEDGGEEGNEPQIMQFKASQKLLSPIQGGLPPSSSSASTLLNPMPAIFTHTTIGKAFIETLNEALEFGVVSESLVERMQMIFEKSLWNELRQKTKLKVVIHGNHLVGSRHIEGQWTLIKRNVSIKVGYRRPFFVDKLKIIAVPRRIVNDENEGSNLIDD